MLLFLGQVSQAPQCDASVVCDALRALVSSLIPLTYRVEASVSRLLPLTFTSLESCVPLAP